MIAIRGVGVVALAGCLLAPTTLAAQDSKSAAVAGQLTQLLDQMKLDAVAAKQGTDQFVAALYFQGSQLLVVAAKYLHTRSFELSDWTKTVSGRLLGLEQRV